MAEITDPELIGYTTNAIFASLNIAEEHGYRRGLIEVGLRMADGSSVDDQMFADVTLTLPSSYDQYEPKDCICGVPPKICSGNHGTACLCTMCGLHGPWKSSTADAIQEWNAWTPLNLLVPKALHCPCGDSPTTYNGPAGNNIKCYSCGLEGGWHIVYGWAINSWNKVVNANRRGEWVGNLKRASATIRGRNLSPDCKLPVDDSQAEINIEPANVPADETGQEKEDTVDPHGATAIRCFAIDGNFLNLCPCGKRPIAQFPNQGVQITCRSCGREGPWAKNFVDAKTGWNFSGIHDEPGDKPVKISVKPESDPAIVVNPNSRQCICGTNPITRTSQPYIDQHRIRLVCTFCGRRGPWAKSFSAAAAAWDADQVEQRREMKID